MKRQSKFQKKNLCLSLLAGLYLTMVSCNEKKADKVTPTPTTSAEAIDKIFFSHIKKAGDELAKGVIWKGYNFGSTAMYLIYRNEAGTPVRGYLINPSEEVSGAIKINDTDNQGLKVYKYDQAITQANNKLKAGNDAYDFDYKIGNGNYYIQQYTDHSVNDYEAISLATHEVFHSFQVSSTWTSNNNELQDENNYPLTKELLSYQLLLLKIAQKMPAETDKTKIRSYLEMFVALRSEEMRLDPSTTKLVKFMANNQEEGEGSARYVEYAINYKIFPDFASNAPSFSDENIAELQSAKDVRNTFAFGIWYGTGASVIYMLDRLGVDIETQIQSAKNNFEVAESFLNLTATQKAATLNKAKAEFNWTAIQTEAARLVALQ